MAERCGAVCVDTRATFDAALNHLHPMTLAWDRVHPTLTVHMMLAQSFLQEIQFLWF